MRHPFHTAPNRGYVLIIALVFLGIFFTAGSAYLGSVTTSARSARYDVASAQALSLAEAGIDKAVYQLNQNSGYAGESDTALGAGTFTVNVTTVDGNTKRVTAIGSVPNGATPIASRTVQTTVSINTSVVSFRYGVQIGNGGLSMNNGSRVNGNIFSNGNISGSGTITGDATVALGTDDNPDQTSEQQNSGFNLGDTTARANVAMGFKPSVSANLTRTTLNIKKVGSPGDITIKIVTDNSGKPSKTVLASGTISAALVGSAYSHIDITYDSAPALTANTQYWIIAIASVNASNYFVWGDDTGNNYSNGTGKYSANWNAGSPVWNSINADMGFRTYMEGALTSISGVTVQGTAWAHSLNNCTVGGDALYQSISGCTVSGTLHPGSADASPAPLPISAAQIADWEATAAAGGMMAGPYSPSGTVTLGPKKINGDLTVGTGATLKLTGPVWVNGDVTFSNNAILTVDASLGASGAIILADAVGNTANKGKVNISNNVTISGNGQAGSYPMVLSTNTGSDAIELENNGSSVILYAPYGTVEVENNGSGKQITANRLQLKNNATVNYVSGLQSQSFSNGPGGSWAVVLGTYAITR
jgi:Tfp pilus assembly protein PilX